MATFKNEPSHDKPARTGEGTLGEAIQDMLRAYRLEGKFQETHVVHAWERVMGKPIAHRTTEVFVRDRKLYVRLSSPPLRHQLSMAREKIVRLLNEDVGAEVIREVILL